MYKKNPQHVFAKVYSFFRSFIMVCTAYSSEINFRSVCEQTRASGLTEIEDLCHRRTKMLIYNMDKAGLVDMEAVISFINHQREPINWNREACNIHSIETRAVQISIKLPKLQIGWIFKLQRLV